MQIRRFHKNRKDVTKAPLLAEGKVKLHSLVNGQAIFEVGPDDSAHTIYAFLSADDVYALLSVRDVLKAERAA